MKLKEVGKHVDNLLYSGNCLGVTVNIPEKYLDAYKQYMDCIDDVRRWTHELSCLKTARKHLVSREEIEKVIKAMSADLAKAKAYLESEYETPD